MLPVSDIEPFRSSSYLKQIRNHFVWCDMKGSKALTGSIANSGLQRIFCMLVDFCAVCVVGPCGVSLFDTKFFPIFIEKRVLNGWEKWTVLTFQMLHYNPPVSYTHLDVYKRQVLFPASSRSRFPSLTRSCSLTLSFGLSYPLAPSAIINKLSFL